MEGREAGAAVGVAESVEEIARLCQRTLQAEGQDCRERTHEIEEADVERGAQPRPLAGVGCSNKLCFFRLTCARYKWFIKKIVVEETRIYLQILAHTSNKLSHVVGGSIFAPLEILEGFHNRL